MAEIQLQDISAEDSIIALLGRTGTGKSTFLNAVTQNAPNATVGHTLTPCTSRVQAVRVEHPQTGKPFVFLDTPGLDNVLKTDLEILEELGKWLQKTQHSNLAGIIYLHNIFDGNFRKPEIPLTIPLVFSGRRGSTRVIIATTMWRLIEETLRYQVENDLFEDNDHITSDRGVDIVRFCETSESAWDIVDFIVTKASRPVKAISDANPHLASKFGTFSSWMMALFHIFIQNFQSKPLLTKQQVEKGQTIVTTGKKIIAVMGQVGTGKSTPGTHKLIHALTGIDPGINHDLEPCRTEIKPIEFSRNDADYIFLDTPGFVDLSRTTEETEAGVLCSLAAWLRDNHQETLTGILYLHRISDLRDNYLLRKRPQKNLALYEALCGSDRLNRVLLVTTMWDDVDSSEGERNAMMVNKLWKQMMGSGSVGFRNTPESAWEIVEKICM